MNILIAILILMFGFAQTPKPAPQLAWQAEGTLLEACSCSVPCPCNFGQEPTGGHCHTIYAYKLKKASYEGVNLDGLIIGGGEAEKGAVGYLDDKAKPEQHDALKSLALALYSKGGASGGSRKFVFTTISAISTSKQFSINFGKKIGGFTADILFGRKAGKPIIVENNSTWPVERFIKGKTNRFHYADKLGNKLDLDGVNANIGDFKFGDEMK